MTLHYFLKYLQHKWIAKSRHGVHSPFAYAFVEDVIENRRKLSSAGVAIPWSIKPAARYQGLLTRMAVYYQYGSVINASFSPDASATDSFDMLLIDNAEPGTWWQLFAKYEHLISDSSAVVIMDIHKTEIHTATWENISMDKKVTMSLDLLGIGILFFRKEFKIPQRFTLREPE